MTVIVVTGVMAAGKSTVGQLLAERFDRSVHLRGDLFRRMIVRGQAAVTPQLSDDALAQLRLRYRIACTVADQYAAAGFTVVLQDIVLGAELAAYVEAITARPRHLVVLAPDPVEIARREAGRPKTGYADGWTPADLDNSLRTETPHLGLWLDSSAQTPDETVTEILDRLGESRL